MNRQAIITFDSTHHAISAQKTLSDRGVSFRVIPTPAEITSDCGIALLVAVENVQNCKNLKGASCTVAVFYGNRLELLGNCVD
jgi:undecaprenyl pyrophosphate synthase